MLSLPLCYRTSLCLKASGHLLLSLLGKVLLTLQVSMQTLAALSFPGFSQTRRDWFLHVPTSHDWHVVLQLSLSPKGSPLESAASGRDPVVFCTVSFCICTTNVIILS